MMTTKYSKGDKVKVVNNSYMDNRFDTSYLNDILFKSDNLVIACVFRGYHPKLIRLHETQLDKFFNVRENQLIKSGTRYFSKINKFIKEE